MIDEPAPPPHLLDGLAAYLRLRAYDFDDAIWRNDPIIAAEVKRLNAWATEIDLLQKVLVRLEVRE